MCFADRNKRKYTCSGHILIKSSINSEHGTEHSTEMAASSVTMNRRCRPLYYAQFRGRNRNLSVSGHSKYTGLFISPSGISELDCATSKTDTTERSISIGRESLQVFFVLGALAYFQVPPLGGSREEKWRSL